MSGRSSERYIALAASALKRVHSSALRTSPTLSSCSCLLASLHPTRRFTNFLRFWALDLEMCSDTAAMIFDAGTSHLAPQLTHASKLVRALGKQVVGLQEGQVEHRDDVQYKDHLQDGGEEHEE